MRKHFIQQNKGFTLVETLVAISIFTVSILGLLIVLSQGITDTNYAKEKIAAGYLTQEGIEYIRNMRDTFVLYDTLDANNGWGLFKTYLNTASCAGSNGCYFDDRNIDYTNPSQPIASLTLRACGSSNPPCPNLSYDSTTGKYGYGGITDSGFSRQIKIVPISNDEIKVLSTVYWKQPSGSFHITFSEDLFNWIQ